MNIFEQLSEYFQFPFVRYALIVGILISICSSILGVSLVLKRFSFIGDGLSHVAFGAMAVAGIVGLTNDMILALPITIICAVILLRNWNGSKIKGDAAIAMISVGALALGYLFMNIFNNSGNLTGDVCSSLFGSYSILTLSKVKVYLCVGLAVITITLFLVFYNKIFAITFDDNFARATGTKVNLYTIIISINIAVVIVLAMTLVGSLLISALIIFPALSAMRVFKSFKSVTICSAVLSVICSSLGIFASLLAETPVGCTIVAVDIIAFIAFYITGLILKGARK